LLFGWRAETRAGREAARQDRRLIVWGAVGYTPGVQSSGLADRPMRNAPGPTGVFCIYGRGFVVSPSMPSALPACVTGFSSGKVEGVGSARGGERVATHEQEEAGYQPIVEQISSSCEELVDRAERRICDGNEAARRRFLVEEIAALNTLRARLDVTREYRVAGGTH
jgi:hypothetical protein